MNDGAEFWQQQQQEEQQLWELENEKHLHIIC